MPQEPGVLALDVRVRMLHSEYEAYLHLPPFCVF